MMSSETQVAALADMTAFVELTANMDALDALDALLTTIAMLDTSDALDALNAEETDPPQKSHEVEEVEEAQGADHAPDADAAENAVIKSQAKDASGHDITDSAPKPSAEEEQTLLDKLSGEIRNQIWCYVFQPTLVVNPWLGNSRNELTDVGQHLPLEPALLRTCHQIRKEAYHLYWGKNIFICDSSQYNMIQRQESYLIKWLDAAGIGRRTMIRQSIVVLDLEVRGANAVWQAYRQSEEDLVTFLELLQMKGLSLKKVEFREINEHLPQQYKDATQKMIDRMQKAKTKLLLYSQTVQEARAKRLRGEETDEADAEGLARLIRRSIRYRR